MNKLMKYATKKFEEQFKVDMVASPVIKLKGADKNIEDVNLVYDSKLCMCFAEIYYLCIDGFNLFRFDPYGRSWESLGFVEPNEYRKQLV